MKIFKKITNGIVLIVIGLVHTNFGFSADAFGSQFKQFSKSYFFKISKGMDDLPTVTGKTDFESMAAFWFFYFGILIIPMGFLVHSVERNKKIIPLSFTISYLIVILIGCYMIPNSGMTFFMLPHALFMIVQNVLKRKNYLKNENFK